MGLGLGLDLECFDVGLDEPVVGLEEEGEEEEPDVGAVEPPVGAEAAAWANSEGLAIRSGRVAPAG